MMKEPRTTRIHKLLGQLCTAALPCVVFPLLSGCTQGMMNGWVKTLHTVTGNAPNPKVQEIDDAWIKQFAIPGKTKDADILHKFCKPARVSQFSNGDKIYHFWDYINNTPTDGTKSVSFRFNSDHTLKNVVSIDLGNKLNKNRVYSGETKKPSVQTSVDIPMMAYLKSGQVSSDKELTVFLETLPKKTTTQILKKRLGNPFRIFGNDWEYLFRTKEGARSVIFTIGEKEEVEYMVIPKVFHEYAMENRARFNVNMVYVSERSPDEWESAAIANCEK